jgi:hypothetical protein
MAMPWLVEISASAACPDETVRSRMAMKASGR